MNDPRNPQQPLHRPMPQPSKSPAMVDPLVALASTQTRPGTAQSRPAPSDRIKIEDDAIELVDDESAAPATASGNTASGLKPGDSVSARKIVAFGPETSKLAENWKRTPAKTGQGACRVKSFHGKYSDEGLRYLDHAINAWLDEHPEVEVKFVTPTVMTFEGKIREPALVLNVWY